MNYLTTKDKLKDEEIKAFEEIDGRLMMIETLKNHGLASFPDTRFMPIAALINAAVIYYGWKFSDTVKRYASYYLVRFYKRNGYEVAGSYGKETIKIPRSVFDEIESYENEWKAHLAKQA